MRVFSDSILLKRRFHVVNSLLLVSGIAARTSFGSLLAPNELWYGTTSVAWATGSNWGLGAPSTSPSGPAAAWDLGIQSEANEPTLSTGTWYAENALLYHGAVLTQSGGTLNITQAVQVGNADGAATYRISAGELTVSANLTNELNIVQGSTFTQTGGTVEVFNTGSALSIGAGTYDGVDFSGAGTYTLDGGTLICDQLKIGNSSVSSGGSVFNFVAGTPEFNQATLTNGGTFEASSSLSAGSSVSFVVNGGNFEVTSNTTVLGIAGVVSGGSFEKTGAGTLFLSGSNTFTGNVTIVGGTLAPGNSAALGTHFTIIDTGATLDLDGQSIVAGVIINGNGVGGLGAIINSSVATANWEANFVVNSNSTVGGAGNITISGSMTNAANATLTKDGSGTLTLSSTNSFYTANTTVIQGTLQLGSSTALGSGTVSVSSGAILDLGGETTSTTNALTLSDAAVTNSSVSAGTFNGNVTLNTDSAFGGGRGDITISGVVGGSGTLDKIGSDTLTLAGTMNGIGEVNVSCGTLEVTSDLTAGSSATLSEIGVNTGAGSSDATLVQSAGTSTYNSFALVLGFTSGDIGTYDISGTAELNVENEFFVGNFGKGIVDQSGNSTVSVIGPLEILTSSSVYNLSGGNLGTLDTVNFGTFTQSGNSEHDVFFGTFENGVGGSYTLSGAGSLLDTTLAASTINDGTFVQTGGAANLANLSGNGTFSLSGGVMSLSGSNNSLDSLSFAFSGGTLATTVDISTSASVTVNAGGATFDTASGTSLTLSSAISGSGGITKTDVGTLILGGANTYSNGTTVSGGELDITSTGSISGGNISVSSGATFSVALGGSISSGTNLTNNGAVNLSMPTATIATLNGTNAAANLTLSSSNLTISGGGSYLGNITDGGTGGAMNVGGGNLSIGSVQVGALTIGGGNLQIGANSRVSSLTLAGSTSNGTGNLDLNGFNKLVLETSNATKAGVVGTLQAAVSFSGYAYSGPGGPSATGLIVNSAPPPPGNYGIAVVDNGALGTPFTSFAGFTVGFNSVLVAPEILGDADLSGTVDLTDLSTVLNNFGDVTQDWWIGNFDGSTTVDLTDLSAVLNNFGDVNPHPNFVFGGGVQRGGTIGGLSELVASFDGVMTAEDLAEARAYAGTIPGYPGTTTATLSVRAVPEPGTAALLSIGVGLMVRRRRGLRCC